MSNYLYLLNGKQCGPLSKEYLVGAGVKRDTLVWCEGMTEWTPAVSVDELASYFANVPPAIPIPTPNNATTSANASGLPPKPDNHLIWGILTTILCCLPFGIVSIVYSNKVDRMYMNGDYEGAKSASRKAMNWAIASAVSIAIITILYFVCIIVLMALGEY